VSTLQPNHSLNPDASPAALTRRPLAAGYLGSLGVNHMRTLTGVTIMVFVLAASAQQFKPYPSAHIAPAQWQSYFDDVSSKYASSRRDFPAERLVIFESPASLTSYAFT